MNNPVDIETEVNNLREDLVRKDRRIELLESMLEQFRALQFGSKSEKLPAAEQVSLFNETEEYTDLESQLTLSDIVVPEHKRRKKKRISLPAELPREEIIYDLEDAEKFCPHDGSALKLIGNEQHEQLDIIPAKVKVLRHLRQKYACPCCDSYVVTAKKPRQAIEKSIASAGLLAYIATSKYADALPLYRQVTILERNGIKLDRTSLANWMIHCGDLVQTIINRLLDHMQLQPVLHMDETPVQVLNEPGRKAQSKSYMWVISSLQQSGQPAVLFNYSPTRNGDTPKLKLNDFEGALMVDGYEGYQGVCDERQLTRLGCWAHARRKFMDAKKQQVKGKSGRADQVLSLIQQLYRVEKASEDFTADQRYEIRQKQSKAILSKLRMWLDKAIANTPPKTAIGKAVFYLQNQWSRLTGYVEDGCYPIDNNRAENSIRPFVIGRKNWMFSTSQKGAASSANLYSIIETAKANGLEPYAYLRRLFTQLPLADTIEDIDKLLPWNCKSVVV